MTFVSNNSDIEITDIGEGESIQGGGLTCATDLPTCCRGTDNTDNPGTPLGEWISPNGTEVPGREESNADIYRDRGMGFIRLNRRNNATSPTGLYCCVIPVNGGGMETFCVNITGRTILNLYMICRVIMLVTFVHYLHVTSNRSRGSPSW